MLNKDIVLFSGYGQLPSGTVAGDVFKVMALVVLLDIRTGEIVEANCTLSTRLAERFVESMVIGRNIHTDYKELVECINNKYQGSAKKSIITALRTISLKYKAYKQNVKRDEGTGNLSSLRISGHRTQAQREPSA